MLINKYKGYYCDSEISKYHIVNDNFKESEIIKIKAYIKTHYSLVEVTEHFERSCKDIGEGFKLHPLWYILKNGKCFEYKLIYDKYLYRMAIRVEGSHYDTIYVIEPVYLPDGSIFISLVTVYTNSPTDEHQTLDTSKYV